MTVGSLNINHAGGDESADFDDGASGKPSGFKSAASILDKYEVSQFNAQVERRRMRVALPLPTYHR